MKNPFRYFNSSPEIIRLTVMLYIHYPLSLRQVEDNEDDSLMEDTSVLDEEEDVTGVIEGVESEKSSDG